jgi:diguanylate cyclase (GGDEF)-like protein
MEKVEAGTEEGIIVIIDLDHFKSINDTFGHIEGDRVLRNFGGELKRFFDHQTVCRYGGEEFAIFLKGVAMEEGFKQIETLREKTAGMDFSRRVTFSAGMAECKDCNVSEAFINADRKLYEAKENGRNQTRY